MYLHAPKRPRYSADPYLQHGQANERWSRDTSQAQQYTTTGAPSRMAPPPAPISSHSARQALVTPDGRYAPDGYQMSSAPVPIPPSRSGRGERWSRPPPSDMRHFDGVLQSRPSSARPPQSPLNAIHSANVRGDEYAMSSSGRSSSRAAAPPELHLSSRSKHRQQERTHAPLPTSAESGRLSAPHIQQQHVPSPIPQYPELYPSRHGDAGPPPFSAASAGSQMLLPPQQSRSRPHSPLRYEDTSIRAAPAPSGAYRSSMGVVDLSPQMASTSISAHQHQRYERAPKDRHGSARPVNSGWELPQLQYTPDGRHEARSGRHDPYALPPSGAHTPALGYDSKVDHWRTQQQQHQQLHPSHTPTASISSSDRHRRMESGDTTRSGGGPLTLPPLGSVVSGHGHGHSNSISRSLASRGPTPSLGRSSRDGSPVTTPGGSKSTSGHNRMGLGHLMD